MNICELAEKIVETVSKVPKKTNEYFCHGDYHSYQGMDKEACELAVQELLACELTKEEVKNDTDN